MSLDDNSRKSQPGGIGAADLGAKPTSTSLPAGAAKKWRAGVLGATGLVGQRIVSLLADHP